MIKRGLLRLFRYAGVDVSRLLERLARWSISQASRENTLVDLTNTLREIVPDISRQELTAMAGYNEYWELKRRTLQAFQCLIMLKAVEMLASNNLTVVDIGDSAGTHMLYLKELTKGKYNINTLSVNLDPEAIIKITASGQRALLCRAEDLDLGGTHVDLFTTFQMVEHLHNPALFFRRLAVKSSCNTIVLTVPYMKQSRVGLHSIRNKMKKPVIAEEEHIFELNPQDWELLLLHSGWKIAYERIYRQYPVRIPVVNHLLSSFWKKFDFEGFWGVILVKDTAISNLYQDWEA